MVGDSHRQTHQVGPFHQTHRHEEAIHIHMHHVFGGGRGVGGYTQKEMKSSRKPPLLPADLNERKDRGGGQRKYCFILSSFTHDKYVMVQKPFVNSQHRCGILVLLLRRLFLLKFDATLLHR